MIVLSVGMPRAGSGWHYNLIHDLMKTTDSVVDARDIRVKYRLQGILTEVNCNIGVLSFRRLGMVAVPALLGNSFVIKAHSAPTPASRILQTLGLLRIVYIYRDPRDAMLSAFDFGQRALQKGRPNAFSHLTDFQKSLEFIVDYVRIWEKWAQERNILVARYEDLLVKYDEEVLKLVDFLKLKQASPEIQKVVTAYRPGEADAGQPGLHFFKGKIGRFRDAYTLEQQAVLKDKLGSQLSRMGYEI